MLKPAHKGRRQEKGTEIPSLSWMDMVVIYNSMQLTFVIIILILLIFYIVAESIDDASPPRKDSKTSKQARKNVEEASKFSEKPV